MSDNPVGIDAYAPAAVAERVEAVGVAKVRQPLLTVLMLAVLAGAFIAFGAMAYTVAVTDSAMGWGPTRVFGGLIFSLGLILVLVAGAELFTGNALIVIALVDGRLTPAELARNWLVVYAGNALGAGAMALLMVQSGLLEAGGGRTGATAATIAAGKAAIPFGEAFVRGILCNALVCLAVWLGLAGRSVTDKVLAVIFPISAFVALGFEHSVANMYLMPVGQIAAAGTLDWGALIANLVPVTLGNIVGGAAFVGLTYYVCYIWPKRQSGP